MSFDRRSSRPGLVSVPAGPRPRPGTVVDDLLHAFVDDAAVFPPGLAPWSRAVTDHLAYRQSPWGAAIGPLLVPVDGVEAFLVALHAAGPPHQVEVSVVSPAGPAPALAARRRLAGERRVRVVGVELPLATAGSQGPALAWSALGAGAAAVWWEVDRERDLPAQLDALAAGCPGAGTGGAKLRTGGTEPAAVAPTPTLAAFLLGCQQRDLPFKLTAGLHHAVRGHDPVTGGTTHGVANVLLATHAAILGATAPTVAAVLDRTDAEGLAADLGALDADDVHRLRARWASFGCCGVLDPLGELARLGI